MIKQTPEILFPPEIESARVNLESAKQQLAAAQREYDGVRAAAHIQCCRCNNDYPISTQEYIQTHWYTSPHGCTGGDYWNEGEANWICPGCGFRNRFDGIKDKYVSLPNYFYRPELVAVKRYFASVRECYCDYNNTPCGECRKRRGDARGR